jgi:hypothetical protein
MRTCRSILALLLLFPFATQAADIFPIKGDPIKAEIVRITDKEVTYKQGDKEVTRPSPVTPWWS